MPYAVLELVVVVIAEKVGQKLFKMIIKQFVESNQDEADSSHKDIRRKEAFKMTITLGKLFVRTVIFTFIVMAGKKTLG